MYRLDRLGTIKQQGFYYASPQIDPVNEVIPMFTSGLGLFLMYELKIMTYPDMRDGPYFGVVPYPKYDEAQEEDFKL